MNQWMQILSTHHMEMQTCHQGRPLAILFDIDGTILDMRFTIYNVLKRFDSDHGTDHFRDIVISDIDFHEEHVTCFLDRLNLSREHKLRFLHRYENLFLTIASDPYAHAPFNGVFDVIRWLQAQAGTYVGLNTGRPESLRKDTLVSLNVLGAQNGVAFSNDMLFMMPDLWEGRVAELKAEGIRHFRKKGFQVCAFIDNEPENLRAVADMEGSEDILLLHADTIFKSDSSVMPNHAVCGKVYDLSALKGSRFEKSYGSEDSEFLERIA